MSVHEYLYELAVVTNRKFNTRIANGVFQSYSGFYEFSHVRNGVKNFVARENMYENVSYAVITRISL